MENNKVSVVVPAHNEAGRIGKVIKETKPHADEILVIDDQSTDNTTQVAEEAGARVIGNSLQKGYIGAIKTGFRSAKGDIILTMDGDGEHDPQDIPRLIKPIMEGKVDLVLGKRELVARPSERFISWLTKIKTGIEDSGTGFRALRRDLAVKLNLKGYCTCGIFALEAFHLGAKIIEIPIQLKEIDKSKASAWKHIPQTYYVAKWLLSLYFGG